MVSVIIPIYNIESLLEECVASVLKQTYTRLEIILVDDGSTDGSGPLCDRLAERDSRIHVFHKTNGGLSDARNYGLARAHGQYVFYLDGDDWLDPRAIAQVRGKADEYEADVVQCGYYYAYPDYLLTRKVREEKLLAKEKAFRELLTDGCIKNFAWGNLLKRELAQKVPFVKGKYFEDIYWKYQIIDSSYRFVYYPEPLVYYRQRTNSISSAFSVKNMDLLEGSAIRLEFFRNKYPRLFGIALQRHWLLAFNFMKASETSDREIAESFKRYFVNVHHLYKADLPAAVKNNWETRMLYFIYRYCPSAYPLFKLFKRIRGRFGKSVNVLIPYK